MHKAAGVPPWRAAGYRVTKKPRGGTVVRRTAKVLSPSHALGWVMGG